MQVQCNRCQQISTGRDQKQLERRIIAHVQNGECDKRREAIQQGKKLASKMH